VLGLGPRGAGAWDRLVDGLNRLPRPLMALGTLAMIAAALVAPEWFAARMEALADMPEPMWWLLAAVVGLFFGGRFQAHEQQFAREMLELAARTAASAGPGAAEPAPATGATIPAGAAAPATPAAPAAPAGTGPASGPHTGAHMGAHTGA
jgi:hypothetical protein